MVVRPADRAVVDRVCSRDRLWGRSGDGEADALAFVLNLSAAAMSLAVAADDIARDCRGLDPLVPPPGVAEWLREYAATLVGALPPEVLAQ